MALLSLLLPLWETCLPLIEAPRPPGRRRQTGVGGQLSPGGEGLAQGFSQECGGARDPDTGRGWSGPGKRGWATRQGFDLGRDVGSLCVQGDELAG